MHTGEQTQPDTGVDGTDTGSETEAAEEIEGTIQFQYTLQPAAIQLNPDVVTQLLSWRSKLFDLKLIGQNPNLYGGYGYGNMSTRTAPGFVITASQTSGTEQATTQDLVTVVECDTEHFKVTATGSAAPSSESVTHGMLYQADDSINFVFHAHSQIIWQQRHALNLPETPAETPYGSPAMAAAVRQLMQRHPQRPLVFATAGHEDGIFSVSSSATECANALIDVLTRAEDLVRQASPTSKSRL